MSSPGLIDFFILEAGEYVERLDALVGAAGDAGPEAAEFSRVARALRGSATMARAGGIAELAGGVERAARALRDGTLWWDAALKGALTSAVDDLKILLHALRAWGAGEDARVRARVAELAAFAPPWRGGSPTPPSGSTPRIAGEPASHASPADTGGPPNDGAARYLATAAAGIVVALADLAANPASREALANVLGRVRALRGVAAVKDLPPLGDVVEAIEQATKPLELGQGEASPEQQAVLAASSDVLRRLSADVLAGRRPDPAAPDVARLAAATAALDESAGDSEGVVPIAELFFADGGPHVVARAPNPPTTPAERFRLEVVSQAEHLRRLVADARRANGGAPGRDESVRRALRHALHALEEAAHGFGENEVAGFVAAYRDAVVALDAPALAALDEVAALLADPTTQSGELARRLGELSRGHDAARRSASHTPISIDALAPGAAGDATRGRSPTPTGRELHALLETGIAGINLLEREPLSHPTPLPEEAVDAGSVVPIETLLYRGQAALTRARELRDALQRGMGTVAPAERAALDELLALIELAATGD